MNNMNALDNHYGIMYPSKNARFTDTVPGVSWGEQSDTYITDSIIAMRSAISALYCLRTVL
jgi:hypothetical protein